MARRGSVVLLLLGSLAAVPQAAAAGPAEPEPDDEGLRQRLTEREDKRRPLRPFHVELGEHALTLGGEYEFATAYIPPGPFEAVEEPERFVLAQELELEAFYTLGPPLSLFAQFRIGTDTLDDSTSFYVERGEMWLHSEGIAGSGLDLDAGRLDFEDERRWWWDEELDALRLEYEGEHFDLSVAAAYELGPYTSQRTFIEPDLEGVLRVLGELSWPIGENHELELFALRQEDFSSTSRPGQLVSSDRADESDARLTWVGARATGLWDLGRRGLVGYWLDLGFVRGDERLTEFEELPGGRSVADRVLRRDVQGWALDVGVDWLPFHPWEPRFFVGYAFASGGSSSDESTDRAFRQSGLQTNEAGFGGVQRFPSYGILLDPELSNLGVLTVGAGMSLLRSSSLDLVYHHYRLSKPATLLRNARLEAELTGEDRDLGHELDLVLALEEWERVEFELLGSVFRAGRAFGSERGTWGYGGFFAVRYAF